MTIDIKELRRLAQGASPGPWKMRPVGDGRQKFAVADSDFLPILTVTDEGGATFGTVHDDADAKFIAAANPAAISELLDRLESAEKDITLKERIIDSLGSTLNAVANERDALRAELADLRSSMTFRTSLIGRIEAERDALRAKIDQMERQEPVAEIGQQYTLLFVGSGSMTELVKRHGIKIGTKLHLAPGAQPAPSVPVDLITDYLVSISAHVAHQDDPKAQAEIGELLRMLAAAPEAKP